MNALVYERVVARFAAARLAAAVRGSGHGAAHGPLRLAEVEPPALPGPEWARIRPRLSGICGSDLATVDGSSSRYFEDLVSFPFIPGHEVVGTVEQAPTEYHQTADEPSLVGGIAMPAETPSGGRGTHVPADTPRPGEQATPDAHGDNTSSRWAVGDRVVIEPVIGCIPRGIDPPCLACAGGHTGSCQHVAFGHLAPGLQIGYCADTGGGWSTAGLVAHTSQMHRVPDALSDAAAVMVEPTACAVHAALTAGIVAGSCVAVIGAGTLGLATVAAIRQLCTPGTLLVGAKHPHQRLLAAELGADHVVAPDQLARTVRRTTRSLRTAGHSTGGADVVVDCVGTSDTLASALSMVRPQGRVVLVGMPGRVHLDLAGLWHREIALVGAYAYGTEHVGSQARRTFDLAFELVASARLERLVSARYPIERYGEAIAHAGSAGRRGAVKIVFDLETRTPRLEPLAPARRGQPPASGARSLPPLRKGHPR